MASNFNMISNFIDVEVEDEVAYSSRNENYTKDFWDSVKRKKQMKKDRERMEKRRKEEKKMLPGI